jgi:hypothetical protein
MEKRQRTRLASAGVLAVVFTSGALVGMAVDRTLRSEPAFAEAAPPEDGERQNGSGGSDGGRSRSSQQPTFLYEQVLTPEQIVVADSLVRIHERARDELRREFRRDTDSIVDASQRPQQYQRDLQALIRELRAAVRAQMTPEQLVRYDSLIAAEDARRRAEREERERQQRGRQAPSGNPPN